MVMPGTGFKRGANLYLLRRREMFSRARENASLDRGTQVPSRSRTKSPVTNRTFLSNCRTFLRSESSSSAFNQRSTSIEDHSPENSRELYVPRLCILGM